MACDDARRHSVRGHPRRWLRVPDRNDVSRDPDGGGDQGASDHVPGSACWPLEDEPPHRRRGVPRGARPAGRDAARAAPGRRPRPRAEGVATRRYEPGGSDVDARGGAMTGEVLVSWASGRNRMARMAAIGHRVGAWLRLSLVGASGLVVNQVLLLLLTELVGVFYLV